eukprot:2258497-Rhodomonas_salina.1
MCSFYVLLFYLALDEGLAVVEEVEELPRVDLKEAHAHPHVLVPFLGRKTNGKTIGKKRKKRQRRTGEKLAGRKKKEMKTSQTKERLRRQKACLRTRCRALR